MTGFLHSRPPSRAPDEECGVLLPCPSGVQRDRGPLVWQTGQGYLGLGAPAGTRSVLAALGRISVWGLTETRKNFSLFLLCDSHLVVEVPFVVSASPEVTRWSCEAGRQEAGPCFIHKTRTRLDSTSCLASRAPSPVASPLRWQVCGVGGQHCWGVAKRAKFYVYMAGNHLSPSGLLAHPPWGQGHRREPGTGHGGHCPSWGTDWCLSQGDRGPSPGGAAGFRLDGPISRVVLTAQAGMDPRRKEEKGVRRH